MSVGQVASDRDDARDVPRSDSRQLALSLPAAVTAVFVVSRVIFALCGVGMDDSLLSANGIQQLLPLDQLQHHLTRSVWYLQSQPPLFNVGTGLLLKLPHFAWHPVMVAMSLLMGAALSLSTLYLCLELGLTRVVSGVIAVLITIDPANVLYQNFYFYAYPTAVLITFGSLALSRYARTWRWSWGAAFFASVSALVLLNSTFQWPWLVVVAGAALLVGHRHWRQMLAVSTLPLLLVGGWYVKNAVLFGTSTTSSWLGMNMARITTMAGPRADVVRLVHEGRLSPLAEYPSFFPISYYPAKYQDVRRTGVAALDLQYKPGGAPNFNNLAYIKLSSDWLGADLRYVELLPGAYLYNVGKATQIYLLPADEYRLIGANGQRIAGYSRVFHVLVDWQANEPTIKPGQLNLDFRTYAEPSQLSVSTLLALVACVFGLPVLMWHRRRLDGGSATLFLIWFSSVYVTVLTCLTEIGENQRFRFDLGPLPLIAAAVVVSSLVARHHPRAASG